MPTVSESITNFLRARKTPANADLVDRYSIAMEVQLNVAADNGEPVEGKRNTYTDGEYEWFGTRIPKNAAGEPEFHDYNLRWPLDLHVEGIGMTGWQWQDRKSLWVAFDFDSITSHARGVGVSDDHLAEIKEAAQKIPYVEVRRSTGGGGLHLYCYLDGIPTENHTVHAALARCVLGMMSSEVGFDFGSAIDACGQVMWVYHRKMSAENHGLEIIKPASKTLGIADLPSNWRDNIASVEDRRPEKTPTSEAASSSPSTTNRERVPLDDRHQAQIDALMRSGFRTQWVAHRHLLQTHTKALEGLLEGPVGAELNLLGTFKTISEGRHPDVPNCFLVPLPNGAWRVYRFTRGTKEAETWSQDGKGWTTCCFNCSNPARSNQTEPVPIRLISCADLDKGCYALDYLIENTLVAKQPCIVAGPKKALKTSLLIDLAISLATGSEFLGRIEVLQKAKVVILSGESGMATLQETARRVCEPKGIRLADIDDLFWSDWIPALDKAEHLAGLERTFQQTGCEVLIVDPAYLAMPGTDAANLFEQGALLRRVSELCQRHGVGLILAHHMRKRGKVRHSSDFDVPELDDIAWTGFAEFARQWLLIGRREEYTPGTGIHKLWLSIGGSAGHSALWAVDINEGIPGTPRQWKVDFSTPDQARAEKKSNSIRQRLLKAASEFPEGETKTVILETAKVKSEKTTQAIFKALVEDGSFVPTKVKKGSTDYPAVRLSPEALKACLEPAGTEIRSVAPACD